MTALKAVLLDADMTLWRIAHQPAQVWQSVLADLGVEVPPRSGVAALACSRDVLAPGWRALETSGFTNDEAAVRNLWLDVEAAVLHELGITLGLEVVERELSRRLIRVVRLYPETAGALAHLSHSYRLAIVSNDSEPLVKARYLGTANHIAVAPGSIHVGCRTPMREICELALSSLDVGLHEAVTGGDSWHKDIAGAANAGIAALHLRRGILECSGAHEVDDLGSLVRFPGGPTWVAAPGPTRRRGATRPGSSRPACAIGARPRG